MNHERLGPGREAYRAEDASQKVAQLMPRMGGGTCSEAKGRQDRARSGPDHRRLKSRSTCHAWAEGLVPRPEADKTGCEADRTTAG
ncbi:hypothetical protein Caka_1396 [Coraliomargarita akajimensis DSM 45221]|uniref:Uncharacterized protein n=1 Tax=Coraliomargarita akajimensis (strain DSM 45221 / IAM 15411 / JCM 23193 / KCTC 12865 / 04OKA010-24) TaxID=583355 RepID=D5EJ16_CORAD|nr:hypothetical protein Caka_1396 [Coraliomargarita akajimensis DSM 45221]